jgi:carbon-monoxide dehydrogenase iron sulfur subunit
MHIKREQRLAMKMIVSHPEKCVACHLCEGACSFRHEGLFMPARTRIWVFDLVDEQVYGAYACFHCSDAPCLAHCPTHAISRRADTGQVYVQEERCIGCKMCMVACPFGVMGFHGDKKVAQNCDLCEGEPQCVKVCVYGALEFAEVEPMPWAERLAAMERGA